MSTLRDRCIRAVYDCPVETPAARVDAMMEIMADEYDRQIFELEERINKLEGARNGSS